MMKILPIGNNYPKTFSGTIKGNGGMFPYTDPITESVDTDKILYYKEGFRANEKSPHYTAVKLHGSEPAQYSFFAYPIEKFSKAYTAVVNEPAFVVYDLKNDKITIEN